MSKFFMMIGLPGSGKSTEARKIAEKENAVIVSSDSIRKELYGNEEIQTDPAKVFRLVEVRIKEALKNGRNAIMDATNISGKRRKAWLEGLKDCKKIAVLMATPIEECIARNSHRERVVPEDVIRNMHANFNIPFYFEGWDDIIVVYPDNTEMRNTSVELIAGTSPLFDFDQKNPHHALSLGEHMLAACRHLDDGGREDVAVLSAALLHDIGKADTQSFRDGIAHYYGHQNAGAYNSLFESFMPFVKKAGPYVTLLRAALIQNHMEPYFWKDEKRNEKCRRLWSEPFRDAVMAIYEADVAAH